VPPPPCSACAEPLAPLGPAGPRRERREESNEAARAQCCRGAAAGAAAAAAGPGAAVPSCAAYGRSRGGRRATRRLHMRPSARGKLDFATGSTWLECMGCTGRGQVEQYQSPAGGRCRRMPMHCMWNPWSQPSHSSIEASPCWPAHTWRATSS
jgi:hypothetical protein